jgi:hypothetical protein
MRTLPVIVGALLVSTAVHYTDNWLAIGDYAPRSGLLPDNPWLVPVAWVLFAAVGVAGYREYRRRGPTTRAHLLLGTFSVSGISTLLHLLYEGNDFVAWQWVSVMSDGILGLAMLGFVLWSASRVRPAAAAAG